jgi:WD40 repeat protein
VRKESYSNVDRRAKTTSPGKRIVTACSDNTLIYWDPRSPTPLFKLTGDDARFDLGGITSLVVNPASTIAVVGGAQGGVRVISLSKGEVISALGGHTEGESVEAIAFVNIVAAVDSASAPVGSTSTNTVVTGATDGKVCIWDLNTSRLRMTLEHKVSGILVFSSTPRRRIPVADEQWRSTGCGYESIGAPHKTTPRRFVLRRPYPSDVGRARWRSRPGA